MEDVEVVDVVTLAELGIAFPIPGSF